MGFKKKAFGVLAAAALTLSMAGGVAAQIEVQGEAELTPRPCGVVVKLVEGHSSDFGEWKWNGSQYALDGEPGVDNRVRISPIVTAPKYNGTCSVTFSTSGLKHGEDTIPQENFVAGTGNDLQQLSRTFEMSQGSNLTFVQLNKVPNEIDTGVYTGTIDVTLENGQN